MIIKNLLKKIPHACLLYFTYIRSITPRKTVNLFFSKVSRRIGSITPSAHPYIAVIDITNICNLRCYHCPTGKKLYGRKPGFIDIDKVKKFMVEYGKYLFVAHLFSWGEPLMNSNVGRIIRLVRSYRVSTTISTNLNTKDKARLEEICESGLDYLIVSIDGATQDVYSRYRVGGKLELVMENLHYIKDYKQRNKLQTPIVEWQYLIFDHNKHEVEAARILATNLVDVFNAKSGIVPKQFHVAWFGTKRCPFLWSNVVLQVDGGIGACCNLIDKEDDFGNLSTDSFKKIWHSKRYKGARSLFSPKLIDRLEPDLKHPCLNCSLVHLQPHLKEYLQKNVHVRSEDIASVHEDDTIAVRYSKDKEPVRTD
ncbi:MAG: radical SAM protein [Candidatus Scalindua rubra]|uniref:Elp3/MiaA/NifB-like radical SAM core domain-containing protein n=1 Tax=Candidatus Scalindua brodae TaxID=237368 RepID=A0A0B0EQA3_9BACT|nr:MAG: hypothetical protein SCABRO_00928 [Candidatus Scalindua brodae]MBZ0109948.1 radical SAM protein [Candidatus Scalindua rubra]TWU35478.1 molybdenum cofactor biosynthesis protein A [Candidatus Brocadiaceae bacterium S225]